MKIKQHILTLHPRQAANKFRAKVKQTSSSLSAASSIISVVQGFSTASGTSEEPVNEEEEIATSRSKPLFDPLLFLSSSVRTGFKGETRNF
jgi:hypothetical protein